MSKIYRLDDPSAPTVEGTKFIRPEQEEAILRMVEEFESGTGSVLNASTQDTGKTLTGCEVIVRMGLKRGLIVGVKDTYQQWADRLADQSDGAVTLRRMDGTVGGRRAWASFYAGDAGWFFTGSQYLTTQDWTHEPVLDDAGNPTFHEDKITGEPTARQVTQRVQKKIFKKMKNPIELIVFDEIHVVSNRKSVGLRTLRTIPTKFKLGMSGTIYRNSFENMWSLAHWAWPDLVDGSSVRWTAEWCEQKTVELPHGKTRLSVVGEKNEGEFVKTLPAYIRLESDLVVPEPEVFEVDMLPEQQADYDALQRDLLLWLETPSGQRATLVADLPITLRTRLRTAALGTLAMGDDGEVYFADDTRSAKLLALRQILDHPDWTGRQAGIYCHSKKFVKVVVKRMRAAGYNAVEWSGDVPSKQRDQIKADFIAGRIQYIVAVIEAFSTGLDGFQAVANRLVWLSESDDVSSNNQAVKRFHRSGSPEMVADFRHVKILCRDTFDEGVLSKGVMATLAVHATLKAA